MVIYGDIVVNFLSILSTKSTISLKKKLKIERKFFFIGFRTKKNAILGDILVNFQSILSTKSTISQKIKIRKS